MNDIIFSSKTEYFGINCLPSIPKEILLYQFPLEVHIGIIQPTRFDSRNIINNFSTSKRVYLLFIMLVKIKQPPSQL